TIARPSGADGGGSLRPAGRGASGHTRRTLFHVGDSDRAAVIMRMSRSAAILTFGAIAWLGHPTEARSEELVTDLSEHLIAIRSNFTGTQILVFGAVETES